MKKLIVAIAAMVVAVSAWAQAGIVVGMTSSETDFKAAAASAKEVTLFHAGVAFKVPLPLGFAIQPAILYNMKGASYSGPTDEEKTATLDYKTGFLEVPVQAQWGLNIADVVRPYVFAEPFVGYAITNEEKFSNYTGPESKDQWDSVKNKLEYGFGLGFGIELFNNLQVSVRKFWNMGTLYSEDGAAVKSFKEAVNEVATTSENEKCSGIMASLTILF